MLQARPRSLYLVASWLHDHCASDQHSPKNTPCRQLTAGLLCSRPAVTREHTRARGDCETAHSDRRPHCTPLPSVRRYLAKPDAVIPPLKSTAFTRSPCTAQTHGVPLYPAAEGTMTLFDHRVHSAAIPCNTELGSRFNRWSNNYSHYLRLRDISKAMP